MPKTLLPLLASILLLQSCAANETVPVAVSCPPPPPVPSVLMNKPVSTVPALNLRFENLLQGFEDSLTKARR